jgi:hypothetical protein
MRIAALAVLLLVAMPAAADISLPGSQHIGDGESAAFDPRDPVTRAQMQANPVNFLLSQATTITAVRLDGVIDLDNQLQVFIDDMTTPRAGTASGTCTDGGSCTYTLSAPLTLGAGPHTIWPDGGCSGGGFAIPCAFGDNDFGFGGIVLVSAQTSTHRSFHRRFHLGDTNDANDDYGGRWYPDRRDASTVDYPFTLEVARVLGEVRFHRLREVAAASQSRARVLVDGALVGTLSANGDPFIVPAGMLLGAGAHTLRIEAGVAAGTDEDDVSWDDIVLVLGNNPATTPGQFNAVDTGADAAAGQLRTKVAGAPFALDIVALSAGAQFTAYTGTVSLELVDASNAALACASWPAVASLGSVTFTGAHSGRVPVSLSYGNALPDARIRMHEPALGITSCSADNFALRPSGFGGITASHGSPTTAGTTEALPAAGLANPALLPYHRAGRPFTVSATAVNAVGAVATAYAGSPTIRATASLLGATLGTAAAGAWTSASGLVRSDAVTYSEAGAVRLVLEDTSFALVDADDTPAAERTIGPSSFDVGRFTPDHFRILALPAPAPLPSLLAGCGGFSYVGAPLRFSPAPFQAHITAMSAAGTVTTNYEGVLYRLPPAAGATTFPALAGGPLAGVNAPNPDNSLSEQGDGVALFRLLFDDIAFVRGAPVVPFVAEVAVQPGALNEADDVVLAPATYASPAAGLGLPFIGTGASPGEMRFGRLVLDNAHGSERHPLEVPLRAEYWWSVAGSEGFVTNVVDDCTTFAAGDVALTRNPAGLATAVSALTTPASPAPAPAGAGSITLSAPNATGQALLRLDAAAAGLGHLRVDSDGDGAYDDDPAATATFGIAKNPERRIFQREVIGN